MNTTNEDKDRFIEMKNDYTNDALSDFVKDKNAINKILELNGQLIQKSDLIYLSPKGARAHFYAPEKRFFNKNVDTFWYNILIIWIMSLILAVTLYFDLLKKIITIGEKITERIGK